MSFRNLITSSILVQMISNFCSMCRNNSKFCLMFYIFFSSIEMSFSVKEMFCVLEYTRKQSKKTISLVFVRKSAMQIWTEHKNFKMEGCLCRAKYLDGHQYWKRWSNNAHIGNVRNSSWNPRTFVLLIHILMNKSYFARQ